VHPVHLLQMLGQRLALRRCEHIADIRDELHEALRSLVGEL